MRASVACLSSPAMLCKLVLVASLAVGVFGRTVINPYNNESYDEYSQNIATELCKATNAEDKVPEVKASIKTFAACVTNEIDTGAIARDIDAAQNTGSYDDVVKKYCAKSPQVKDCTRDFIKGLAPCLRPGAVGTSEKSTFALIDFLCDNDGARIISFVKEDGLRCFLQNRLELAFCQSEMKMNVTKVANVYGNGTAGMMMIPEKEHCGILDDGLSCFTNALKSCSNKTPGNLAQELHDIYLKSTSCTRDLSETQNAPQAFLPSSGIRKDLDFLMKRKLELEVRTAELDIWKRENELKVHHTILTSDVKSRL